MQYVVIFDTEAAAEVRQAEDLTAHKAFHGVVVGSDYDTQTTRWATPRPRLDGHYDYDICTHADYEGCDVQEYSQDNYQQYSEVAE